MLLELKNIGKIEQASVEINGITVIAGENDTGKSTVGKVLYSIFNSFYNIDEQIQQQRKESIANSLVLLQLDIIDKNIPLKIDELTTIIMDNRMQYMQQPDKLKEDIAEFISKSINERVNLSDIKDDILTKIFGVFNVSDKTFLDRVLTNRFRQEFSSQINNIYFQEKGTISLFIKEKPININVTRNHVYVNMNKIKFLNTEAICIDDPFILDEMNVSINKNIHDHRIDLKTRLRDKKNKLNTFNEILIDNKLQNIYKRINTICEGDLEISNFNIGYKKPDSKEVLNIKNISTGLKTFVILKTLLQNGWIEDNGTIILDEPEIHLHPEWQLLFARLIVLLQKEFNLHILLTTHSPYFLNAIEVYSAKYNITNKCKYYLAVNKDNTAIIQDVTDNTEEIYAKLARPLQDLENEEYGL